CRDINRSKTGMLLEVNKIIFSILFCVALLGCSETKELVETVEYVEEKLEENEKFKENVAKALEKCGKGNVESVTIKGFTCFE
ncbi:hypothetical protein, partial [Biformimicrobium ophioploci]|uniref:hypothetical protein n=1 Tax=Biformimicrobium ophioploci TaxID=3036711 RepID=UPI0025552BF7